MHFIYPFIASFVLSHRTLDYLLTPDEYVQALFREKNPLNHSHHIVLLASFSTKVASSPLITLKQKLARGWNQISTPQQVLLSSTEESLQNNLRCIISKKRK